MEKQTLLAEFQEHYDYPATNVFFSPGRVNLIGEHTDYNGGHVFPAAITLGTYAAVAAREDQTLHLFSANFPEAGELVIDLTELAYDRDDTWANYVKGMFKFIFADSPAPFGLDLLIHGDLPAASGLSSSASLELLIGTIIVDLYDLNLTPLDLVKLGKRVENEYIGVNSGIMDQFAVGMGETDKAIFLDTNTLEYELFDINLADCSLVIMNTNKPRNLINGKYNERRAECEEALARLQKVVNITALGDLTAEQFDEYSYAIGDETLVKRARHAVLENQRTLRAGEAMRANDLAKFGRLMNASHLSLEYDYEVTGIELDTLVHTAWTVPGVLGARMTGAGFGGCAIALVQNNAIAELEAVVGRKYAETTDFTASFYLSKISAGPHEL